MYKFGIWKKLAKQKPKNIILIIADSLRYDSVYENGPGVPYMEKNAVQFTNASSAACWTLPATSSMFTGLLPHEHQATTQSRSLCEDRMTLAEIMKSQGYATYQVTSNVATTEIFGLDKGFDEVIKSWHEQDPVHNKFWTLLMMMGKPRIRNKVLSKRLVSADLSQDLKAGSVWLQNFRSVVFNKANDLLKENTAKGKGTFLFLNLMETHFPYHTADRFQCESENILKKIKELKSLYKIVNQSFLKSETDFLDDEMLELMRNRQKKAWQLIKQELDEFVRSLHENSDNLVVFASDHGENFGDQNWLYHFSNVTDACTRVPIFWLDNNGMGSGLKNHGVNSSMLYYSLAKAAGHEFKEDGQDLFEENALSTPISQSFWYDSQGRTLEQYKFNQFCFKLNGDRYLHRNGKWHHAKATDYENDAEEPHFIEMSNTNPIQEFVKDQERKSFLEEKFKGFQLFEESIKKH